MIPPPVTDEHRWLHRLLGEWAWYHEAVPGQPGEDHEHGDAWETWRKLGEVWTLGEGSSEYGPTLFTLGYHADAGRFVGSFVTAMMTYFWVYEGHLETADKLVLRVRGPSMGPEGGLADYRDEIEFLNPDERVLRSFAQQADGTWAQFMQARYRRR